MQMPSLTREGGVPGDGGGGRGQAVVVRGEAWRYSNSKAKLELQPAL